MTHKIWSYEKGGTANAIDVDDIGFLMAVSLGLINGVSAIRKSAFIGGLQSATGPREIWDFGSPAEGDRDYIYPADGTAPIDSISSSDNGDNQLVRIDGLDIDGNFVSQEFNLTGQTRKALTTPLWRVDQIINIQPSNTANRNAAENFTGKIYLYENTAITLGVPNDLTKVRGFVYDGNNRTLMSQYTIPAGKVGIMVGFATHAVYKGTASILIDAYLRPYGGLFSREEIRGLNTSGTGVVQEELQILTVFDEKTDIVITADTDTNNAGASIRYSIVLFDKDKWPGAIQ